MTLTRRPLLLLPTAFYLAIHPGEAFLPLTQRPDARRRRLLVTPNNPMARPRLFAAATALDNDDVWKITVDMPPKGSELQAFVRIAPILSVPSEIVPVRYDVPFALNVAPKNNLCVCTQDGPNGEKVGDVLRYCSQWTLGLPRGEGLANTVGSFAGSGVSWQASLFDVMKAKVWEQVVQALTSNTQERTDEVVLLFERPLEGVVAPEVQ